MADRGPSYGLSKELADKAEAKFSLVQAKEAVNWVEQVIGRSLGDVSGPEDFYEMLKDGRVLCELINKIKPGSVKKINTMNAPFKQRENLEQYIRACAGYGLRGQDLFQVNDLYESKNLYMVVDNLHQLGGQAQKNGWAGPALGVKVATENKREFEESVLKEGQNVIGLQYGTNKGASQQGMAAYGTGRQIHKDFK